MMGAQRRKEGMRPAPGKLACGGHSAVTSPPLPTGSPVPAALASPGNLLEMYILEPHPRANGVKSGNLCFNSPPGISAVLKLKTFLCAGLGPCSRVAVLSLRVGHGLLMAGHSTPQ